MDEEDKKNLLKYYGNKLLDRYVEVLRKDCVDFDCDRAVGLS